MVGKYTFEVGILNDAEHKQAQEHGIHDTPDLKSYAGGPIRKTTRKPSGKSISQVFKDNQERLNTDMLKEPFQKKSSDIIKFTDAFLKMVFSPKSMTKRVENLLQAIVRNPILRGDYGDNTATTADNKGFNRGLIDTAQMFKSIRARVIK